MGRDKLLLEFKGASLLQGAVERFRACFDRVAVSVGDIAKYPEISVAKIADIYKDAGPLSGLHAALTYLGDDIFLTAADMPFSSPAAAKKIIELCEGFDICVPTDEGGRYEPLFACYKKSVLPRAEKALSEGRYSMLSLYDGLKVRKVSAADLGGLWTERLLTNINRPADYEELRLELGRGK